MNKLKSIISNFPSNLLFFCSVIFLLLGLFIFLNIILSTSYFSNHLLFISLIMMTGSQFFSILLFVVSLFLSIVLADELSLEKKSIMKAFGVLIAIIDLCYILFIGIIYAIF